MTTTAELRQRQRGLLQKQAAVFRTLSPAGRVALLEPILGDTRVRITAEERAAVNAYRSLDRACGLIELALLIRRRSGVAPVEGTES